MTSVSPCAVIYFFSVSKILASNPSKLNISLKRTKHKITAINIQLNININSLRVARFFFRYCFRINTHLLLIALCSYLYWLFIKPSLTQHKGMARCASSFAHQSYPLVPGIIDNSYVTRSFFLINYILA